MSDHEKLNPPPDAEGDIFRQCRCCGQSRPLPEFGRSGKSTRGHTLYRHVCTPCRNRYKTDLTRAARTCIEDYAAVLMKRVRDRSRVRAFGRTLLSEGWVVRQWDKQRGRCFYSGEAMSLLSGPKLVTVERLDVNLGYVPDNCVLACFCINMMRGSVPIEEFVWWCAKVASNAASEGKEPK